MASERFHKKPLDEGEYIVAIRTGLNYWHILTGRENMVTMEEAEDYLSNFEDTFNVAILKVEKVTRKVDGHKS